MVKSFNTSSSASTGASSSGSGNGTVAIIAFIALAIGAVIYFSSRNDEAPKKADSDDEK